MFTLSISTNGGERLMDERLMRFASNLETPKEALEAVGDVIREAVGEQFSTEGGHASGGWKPLTAERLAFKEARGLQLPILQATERLKKALEGKFAPGHIERLSGDALIFGTDVSYAIFHQSSRPRRTQIFRPPIALTEQDKKTIRRRVTQALLAGMKASGDKAVWGA
jgi:phage gpG-like protein